MFGLDILFTTIFCTLDFQHIYAWHSKTHTNPIVSTHSKSSLEAHDLNRHLAHVRRLQESSATTYNSSTHAVNSSTYPHTQTLITHNLIIACLQLCYTTNYNFSLLTPLHALTDSTEPLTHEVAGAKSNCAQHCEVYCMYVPIEQREGLCLVVDHIQGGYKMLLGKPWILSLDNLHAKIRRGGWESDKRSLPEQCSTPLDDETIVVPPQKLRRMTRTWRRMMNIKEWYPGELEESREGCFPAREDNAMEIYC